MKKGRIVLTPFPFTDLHGKKVRPAVIVSSNKRKGNDIIVSFISSIVNENELSTTDLLIRNTDAAFKQSGLKVTSIIKADKLATLSRDILLGELGSLSKEIMHNLDEKIKLAFDIE